MKEFRNKKIAILGLGVEGAVSAKFLGAKGAKIWILDQRKKESLESEFLAALEGVEVEFVLGEEYLSSLSKFDLIVRSPGIKRSLPELKQAEKNGVVITSQTKLFFDLCPSPIIGITGTKGKGTTSTLIYEMLKTAGRDVYLGGNIGVPPFEFLDNLTGQSLVVLELSSFQLQDLTKSPHIGVMLMVTSEHLDYHATLEEYVDAKRNLLRFQTTTDFAIVNRDYPASNESDIETNGKVFYVSRERETDNGCFALNGKILLRKNANEQEILTTKEIFLPGKHNLENVCAAVMAADLAGVKKEYIVHVLKTFKGLEHRLELVEEIGGVKYYDDSFSTIPETTIAAIEAFEAPEVLVLGGSSKNSNFSELGKVIREAKNIRAIIGIGEEWERIKDEIRSKGTILLVEGAVTMEQVVKAANKIAKEGDVVLLSPACASFDMFKNYKERGEQFKTEVRKLGLE